MAGTSEFGIGGNTLACGMRFDKYREPDKYEITFGYLGNDLVKNGIVLAETTNGKYNEEPTARQELIDLGAENLADMILWWVKNGSEI